MIIDSHCHAWRRWPYDAAVPDPDHRGSVDALLYELDAGGVERAAVVCARIGHEAGPGCANDDNNDYVAAAAGRHPDRLVTVADVDSFWRPEHHTPGAADRLREAAERYALAAFTHYVTERDDGWFGTNDGLEFFAAAAELDLVASLAVPPAWFDAVGAVAAAHPTLPILLHHLGHVRPGDDDAMAGLLALAGPPNVLVKVCGFHYLTAPPWGFPFEAARERVLRPVADAFGPHRLAWGSDFPAARTHVTYTQSLAVVRDHTPWWTDAERDLVLGGTLDRVLRTRRPLRSLPWSHR
ncbi:amidohydrolase family protein [Jiangella asiatica]|uniref:amidohydrolase family protein n=1 Tax=Jiangella asiatica TaxID=2530372 RepID=UPI0013A5E5AD|nr:amidohydrolase family protein [Jiangella asiatica]